MRRDCVGKCVGEAGVTTDAQGGADYAGPPWVSAGRRAAGRVDGQTFVDGFALMVEVARHAGRSIVRLGAMSTGRWRPLPDVVIIGVKRGGTTSLFRDLERHPAMCPLVPSARRLPLRENLKGVHYFDSNSARSERWYRSHFPTTATLRIRRRHAGHAFTAEASPYYFFHPLAAERARHVLPATQFVVMLRDPIERTVSHWAEQVRNGVEHLSFVDALAAEPLRIDRDSELLRCGTLRSSRAHEHQSYASQSEYATSLQRWFDAVGPNRVSVLFAEDYYRDAQPVLDAITNRLGVEPLVRTTSTMHRNAAARPGVLEREVEDALVERFSTDVDRVATMIGRRPPWPRFAQSSA